MPVEVTEKFESRQITTDVSNPSVELRYTIRGTNDDVEARSALADTSPAVYDPWGSGLIFLPRVSISVDPVGDNLWEGVVRYGTIPQTNESVTAFEVGGGVQHITQSRQTVGRYTPSWWPFLIDFKGAIGVSEQGVQGVDIVVPVYRFTETHYLPDDRVTSAYRGILYALHGKVNSAAFRGFEAGECLFAGVSGAKRGQGDWELTYQFAASPNMTNLTVGEITGIAKKGWEYLWVYYRQRVTEDGRFVIPAPMQVNVEQVYDYGDFSLLGI